MYCPTRGMISTFTSTTKIGSLRQGNGWTNTSALKVAQYALAEYRSLIMGGVAAFVLLHPKSISRIAYRLHPKYWLPHLDHRDEPRPHAVRQMDVSDEELFFAGTSPNGHRVKRANHPRHRWDRLKGLFIPIVIHHPHLWLYR